MKVLQKIVKKEGKTFTNFYLELDNGIRVAFKPSFFTDYGKLRGIAEKLEDVFVQEENSKEPKSK